MRSSSPARRLTGALILACLVLSACSEAEPEPTACPVPSFPPVTTPVEGATPPPPAEDSSDSLCSAESLSSVEASTLLQDAAAAITIIDTRTPAEYAGGHIPGAVNLSTQDAAFWDQVRELPLGWHVPALLPHRQHNPEGGGGHAGDGIHRRLPYRRRLQRVEARRPAR